MDLIFILAVLVLYAVTHALIAACAHVQASVILGSARCLIRVADVARGARGG